MFIQYKLSNLRHNAHMTQKELSRKSGVSVGMISFIENNQRHPTLHVLALIAQALCVQISDLFVIYDDYNQL